MAPIFQVINATKDVSPDDIIVAFMGPTGCGKSFFIDLLTDQKGRREGSSLASVTSEIGATRLTHPEFPNRNIVLVDTPGFDDTTRSDMQILYMISDWLKQTYQDGVKLSGLIYLHRISDNRMAGSPFKNLRMFGELCGDMAMTQVIMVTTMWGRVNRTVGEAREQELKTSFWAGLIEKGSRCDRLGNATFEAAWDVVKPIIHSRLEKEEELEAVLLQEELVDHGIELKETGAGRTLYTNLQKQLAEQKESMKALLVQVDKSKDDHLIKELQKEYARIQQEFDRTFDEVGKLKVSGLKKAFSFLNRKKTRASAVKVKSQHSGS